MKFSNVILLALAVSLVNASPIEHVHHAHEKREVVTLYTTVVVGANGADTTSTSASLTTFSETTATELPIPTSGASTLATSIVSGVSSSASSSTLKASSSADLSGNAAAAVGAKGITYSPYTDSGSCKTGDEIQSDVAKLSDFDIIRVYAPDCSCIENILQAKTSSQKIFAGLYYMDSLTTDIETLSNAVKEYGSWDDIYTVSVGNEWVNSGEYTVAQVSSAVSSSRTTLESAGYSGYVVSVDTLVAVQDNTALCSVSDYIAVNSHPYWDGSVEAADSGSWLKTQISNIKSTCGGDKDVLITETGWPNKGDTYGVAVPSEANQYTAVSSIVETVGDQVLIFTMYNDYWKSPGSYGVEQNWGIFGDSPE